MRKKRVTREAGGYEGKIYLERGRRVVKIHDIGEIRAVSKSKYG